MSLPTCVSSGLLLLAAFANTAPAQQWNGASVIELATRAVERRLQQIADTMLADYTAEANGKLIFQGRLGEGFSTPPITVKATEIVSRLYWSQPGRSKQVIVGLRDTMLLPGNISYYAERYGIIQNNFPDVIRLGGGNDVADVPHPLSRQGLNEYDFAIRDSLSIGLSGRTIEVVVIAVRPKNDALPRVIGFLYIERASADVVKMQLTFTKAALIDRRNEVLTVTLENALVEGRFWLPRRQEMSLTRSDPTWDLPASALIRAWWDVCCYALNISIPAANFTGPEIVRSSPQVLQQHEWKEPLVKVLPPDVRILTPGEVRVLRESAEQYVRAGALNRAKRGSLFARRISDFVRVNRAEGLALGMGARLNSGSGLSLAANGRYGISDQEPKGRIALIVDRIRTPALELYAERDYIEAGDIPERSATLNSIAAPAFGSDYTDPYDARAAGLSIDLFPLASMRPRVDLRYETSRPVSVNLHPWSGAFSPTLPAFRIRAFSVALSMGASQADAPFGTAIHWSLATEAALFAEGESALSVGSDRYFRAHARFSAVKPLGSTSLAISAFAGTLATNGQVPPQKLFYLGGPVSAAGYGFHELAGTTAASLTTEFRLPVPFPSMSLGKYGRSPPQATFAPYLSSAYIADPPGFSLRRPGFYPTAGIGLTFFYDLLRVDVARGLRGGGRWSFSFDVMKDLWSIL